MHLLRAFDPVTMSFLFVFFDDQAIGLSSKFGKGTGFLKNRRQMANGGLQVFCSIETLDSNYGKEAEDGKNNKYFKKGKTSGFFNGHVCIVGSVLTVVKCSKKKAQRTLL